MNPEDIFSDEGVVEGSPYRTVLADPPWRLPPPPPGPSGFPTLSQREIESIPVIDLVEADSCLYLWVTRPNVEAGYHVARAWGFECHDQIVWVKRRRGGPLQTGMGSEWRYCHEILLYCRRGRVRTRGSERSVLEASKTGRFAGKPIEFYEMIERQSPSPYLELFARRRRPGWASWGNQI